MPRKKTKGGMKSTTKQGKSMSSSMPLSMEKEFRAMPMRIASEYRKQTLSFKQQEKMLMLQMKKTMEMRKAAQDKMNSSNKKSALTAKKNSEQLTRMMNDLSKQLDQMKKCMTMSIHKQNLYMAMMKEMVKFEKSFQATSKKSAKKVPNPRKPIMKKDTKVSTPMMDSPIRTPMENEMPEMAMADESVETQS